MHVWIPQESFSSNWRQLQATTCVLNIELSTPERATMACNSWAVSPASIVSFVNLSSDSAPKYLLLELCIKVITLFINFSVWFFVAFFFQFAFLNLTETRVTCEPSLRHDEILEDSVWKTQCGYIHKTNELSTTMAVLWRRDSCRTKLSNLWLW